MDDHRDDLAALVEVLEEARQLFEQCKDSAQINENKAWLERIRVQLSILASNVEIYRISLDEEN